MTLSSRVRPGSLVLVAALAFGAPTAALAGDAKPNTDDKCMAQCDSDADKCMQIAGKDASKARACDTTYDECQRKCT